MTAITPADQAAITCRQCGACCAAYRVSFYWADAAARGLPDHLTTKVNDWIACMAGTHANQPRCVALQGDVGRQVVCTAYTVRPAPCREVEPGDAKCRTARARHGLAALPAPPLPALSAA